MKSVSREAENRREKDQESSRKKTSVIKALGKRKPSDHFTRADQHASAPIDQNLGSNRNTGQEPEFSEGFR